MVLKLTIFQKKFKKIIGNKNITTKIYRIQAHNSFVFDLLILFLKDKSLLEYKNLFSPNDYENNNNISLKYFALFVVSIENLKNLKYRISYKKH